MLKETAVSIRQAVITGVDDVINCTEIANVLNEMIEINEGAANQRNKSSKRKYEQLYKSVYGKDGLSERKNQLQSNQFHVGIAGGQSSGKSVFGNTLMRYPVLPVSTVVTTTAVVRMKYSEIPYIDVLNGDNTLVKTLKGKIPQDLFIRLKDYMCWCALVIGLENIHYFTDVDVDEYLEKKQKLEHRFIDMSPDDPRHIITLFMTLLATYIGQNSSSKSLSPEENELLAMRNELYKSIGLDPDENYILELGWDAPILHEGLCIVDLPGLNAMVGESRDGKKGHDEITLEAIRDTDAILFVFDEKGPQGGAADTVLGELLASARLKHLNSKEQRIVGVVNKIDIAMMNGGKAGVNAVKSKVFTHFKSNGLGDIPVFGVSALKAAESIYITEVGIPMERTRIYKNGVESGFFFRKEDFERVYQQSCFEELSAFLFEYSIRSMVYSSFDVIYYLHDFSQKFMQIMSSKLETYTFMYSNVESSHTDIITLLKRIVNDVTNIVLKQIRGTIDTKINDILSTFLRRMNSFSTDFKNQVQTDVNNAKRSFLAAAESLDQNWLGEVILSRKGVNTPNAAKVSTMMNNFEYYTFTDSYTLLSNFLAEQFRWFVSQLSDLDNSIAKVYDTFESEYKELVGDDIEKLKGRDLPTTYISFLNQLSAQINSILHKGSDIKSILKAINTNAEFEAKFKNIALNLLLDFKKECYSIARNALSKNTTYGIIMKRTELIYYNLFISEFTNTLDEANFPENIGEVITAKLNSVVSSFLNQVISDEKKTKAAQPATSMQEESLAKLDDAFIAYGVGKGKVLSIINDIVRTIKNINGTHMVRQNDIKNDSIALANNESDPWTDSSTAIVKDFDFTQLASKEIVAQAEELLEKNKDVI